MLSVYLNELHTVADCRDHASKFNSQHWDYGAKRLAKTSGKCLVHLCDGRLLVFTAAAGKVSRKAVKSGKWTVNRELVTW